MYEEVGVGLLLLWSWDVIVFVGIGYVDYGVVVWWCCVWFEGFEDGVVGFVGVGVYVGFGDDVD